MYPHLLSSLSLDVQRNLSLSQLKALFIEAIQQRESFIVPETLEIKAETSVGLQ